ncbi:hypothetical protein ACGFYP_01275 [Streptomyces sp. NPDC048370]|uniref:hypothetical protein n=1 Tax=Streptomyces sp. NPDC048370 TaxID=3365540 RepID=UPI003717A1B0
MAATLALGMLVVVKPTPAEAATADTHAWYVLVNRNSGKAVEVHGGSTADGGAFDGSHLPGPVDGSPDESGVATWTKREIWRFFAQFQ